MKAWPKDDDMSISDYDYHRARADAAMERLRVAVEALKAADDNFKHDRRTVGMIRVKEALNAIGELPE
jgi:hypothetical protein